MDMIKVKYRFTRVNNSVAAFLSSNSTSTDALIALFRWKAGAAGRGFAKLVDEDDYIDVEVTCNPNDKGAGEQLAMESDKVGVERNVLT